MKTALLILLIATTAHGMGFWDSLAQIETGANDKAVGGVGELGRYQVRPEYWTPTERAQATNPSVSIAVAQRHMLTLTDGYKRLTGHAASEVDMVVLWKSGLNGYARRGFDLKRMSAAHKDRVERFINLRNRK